MGLRKCPECNSKDIIIGPTARRRNEYGDIVKQNPDECKCRMCGCTWIASPKTRNRLVIQISAPIEIVYEFTVNPVNTPKWIDHIVEEEASTWPPVIGTTYRNRIEGGEWSEYEVVDIKENAIFELASKTSTYHVRYTYMPVVGGTELDYFEWVEEGELEGAFEQSVMVKLKNVIEQSR